MQRSLRGRSVIRVRFVGALFALAASAMFGMVAAGPASGAEFGLDRPLIGKTHATISLAPNACANSRCQRLADLAAIESAAVATQAGAHPDGTVSFKIRDGEIGPGGIARPAGTARDIVTDLPAGFIGNPEAVPACSRELLGAPTSEKSCSPTSQVGVATVDLYSSNVGVQTAPVYRVDRPQDAPAAFGFNVEGQQIILTPELRSDGDYGLRIASLNTSGTFPVKQITVTLWGVPMDGQAPGQGHYDDRWDWQTQSWGIAADHPRRPFLINPPRCNSGDLATNMTLRAWEFPNRLLPRDLTDPAERAFYTASAPEPTGCQFLPPFTAQLDMRPADRRAATPAGYETRLEMPYNDDPDGLAYPYLKKTEVRLPAGVSVSPSAALGLVGCSDAQAGFGTQHHAACPDASKIAQVSVGTPLLPDRLHGAAYIGTPTKDQLLRLFIILKGFGVTVRVAGDIHPDPVTGQIRAVFDDNPQLPFTDLEIKFDTGPRASLVNPMTCGRHTTVTKLTSWNGDVTESRSSFTVDRDPDGRPCAAGIEFSPDFVAGTTDPTAGTFTDFAMHLTRQDSDQQVDKLSVSMPQGLVAKLAGIPLCGAAQADAGSCGEGSRIGRVVAASGAGSDPFWVPGPGKAPTAVFLAGPYRGAPYSLSVMVPAQAGPFDLGRVVVRSPIWVDERTAQISVDIAESRIYDRFGRLATVIPGKMPHILEGIPLLVKELRVIIDRDEFMVNPTRCRQMPVEGTIGAVDGRSVQVSSRFRATDCAALGFAPRFRAKILNKGRRSTVRSWHPRTRFTVVPRPGDANIGGARVALPSSTILDQANIGTTCTRAQMAARDCPARSLVGYARAWSPLLNRAVKGPVYLAANGGVRPLPDLVAILDGEVRIVLVGEISTLRTRGKARLQNTFRVVPDAPVSRFVLTMRGGKRTGLLVNSEDLCRSRERGVAAFHGQNGKRHRLRPRVGLTFKGCRKVRRKVARRAAKRKATARRSAALRNPSGPVRGRR